MSTATAPVYEWKTIPWRKLERMVFKLQTRIYQATRRGDVKAVHKLQRLLVTSWAARCLAVRRVTQDNRGKHTAGVDGVKSLTPPHRLQLATTLPLAARAQPLRRVWIPKPGTDEHRPLSIPTIRDRAAQRLLTLALEPEWEARFEPNVYGFRPGRSAHDAIAAIFNGIKQGAKFVLDADIAKCFERINHAALLRKLNTRPTFRRTVKRWLQAGVMDGPTLFPTEAGTPQGGGISPLLANVALHGLEHALRAAVPKRAPAAAGLGRAATWQPVVVRYADDFVVLHRDQAVIEQCQQLVAEWLSEMGLELKPSKTRIGHTLDACGGTAGFDFLGFHVRQYRRGKTHEAHRGDGPGLGFKTLIKPSVAAQRRHDQHLRDRVRTRQGAPQDALLQELNPVIRGWSQYYATGASSKVFRSLDNRLYHRLRRWAKFRHPHKSGHWVAGKYWRLETGKWVFGTRKGTRLYLHSQTPIRRYTKVKGDRSPYDGDWSYWATRLGRHSLLPPRVAWLLRQQRGRCAWCGLFFRVEDVWEVDHIVPRRHGGSDRYTNLQLLHRHCHDVKTARDGSLTRPPRAAWCS